MRCPKCKFISFDDLSNCAKCANDLSVLTVELNGTCKETNVQFFLGSVVKLQDQDEQDFSESQALPPIDQDAISFEDTITGEFAAFAKQGEADNIDLDDSFAISQEDDISIELGDIMPIDLEQLDLTDAMSDNSSESAIAEKLLEDDSPTVAIPDDDDIDLNLTQEFANDNLDLELNENFSDIDLDDTDLPAADDTAVIHPPVADEVSDSEDAVVMPDNDDHAGHEVEGQFDLDDELVAELADSTGDLDATATLSDSEGNIDTIRFSSSGEFSTSDETLDLDDSLLSELSEDEPSYGTDLLVSEENNEQELSETKVEKSVAGVADANDTVGDEEELSPLDFSDIDVSDLVSTPDSDIGEETDSLPMPADIDEASDHPIADDEDAQEPILDVSAEVDSEDVIYNEIDELDLDVLDDNDLAMLDDDTAGFEADSSDQDKTANMTLANSAASDDIIKETSSEDELPEAEVVSEGEDDDKPPDLPT